MLAVKKRRKVQQAGITGFFRAAGPNTLLVFGGMSLFKPSLKKRQTENCDLGIASSNKNETPNKKEVHFGISLEPSG